MYGAEVGNGALGGGSRVSTGFRVPRISLISETIVKNDFAVHLQLNYDDHIDSRDSQGRLGIVEAFVEPVLPNETQLRLGLLIPPISLEHPSVGWNTLYTITPSAINSWVGEEIRTLAAEVTQNFKLSEQISFKLLLAGYSGNDPAGAILSWRGWALHDYQYKQGDRLRFQPDIPVSLSANGWNTPSKELDGRLGFYSKISYEREQSFLPLPMYSIKNDGHNRTEKRGTR